MSKLPKSFQLLGLTYTVHIVPQADWLHDDAIGVFLPERRRIEVLDRVDEAGRIHVYLHELVHAILVAMGQDKLNEDEAFVDMFSGLLHQALT